MFFRSMTQITRYKVQAQQRSVGYCAINCNANDTNTGKGRVHPMTILPLKMHVYTAYLGRFYFISIWVQTRVLLKLKFSLRWILINAQCNKSSYLFAWDVVFSIEICVYIFLSYLVQFKTNSIYVCKILYLNDLLFLQTCIQHLDWTKEKESYNVILWMGVTSFFLVCVSKTTIACYIWYSLPVLVIPKLHYRIALK